MGWSIRMFTDACMNYFVGNHRLAHGLGVCSPEIERQLVGIEAEELSVVVVGHKPHSVCKGEPLT